MKTAFKEKDLTEKLKKGDIAAFNSIYKNYHQAVYVNILKIVSLSIYAEEILQDVFISLWQHKEKIRSEESLGGWLFVVSFNKSLTFFKRNLKESIHFIADYQGYENFSEDDLEQDNYLEQLALLEQAVACLPNRKKQVFELCRFEGRSKEDVALLLGISKDSVKDYLKQANKTIKEYIFSHYPHAIKSATLIAFLIDRHH